MRHRCHDAVEVFQPVGRPQEIPDVLDADLNRNQYAVMSALGKGACHAAGRFHLR